MIAGAGSLLTVVNRRAQARYDVSGGWPEWLASDDGYLLDASMMEE
jgi:hypothetical protein